jgi:hypothetical protein
MLIVYTTRCGAYFTPLISIRQCYRESNGNTEFINYIEISLTVRHSMTRADLDREIQWLRDIETVFDNVGVNRAFRKKIIQKIGEFIYEVECRLSDIPTVHVMTLQELRGRWVWLNTVYFHSLGLAGLTALMAHELVFLPRRNILRRMREVRAV